MLDKLQNDRTDDNATPDFAAVDASPTARDIYYDHDSDADTPDVWRTILVSPQGFGGTSIFALDVTDPRDDQWKVLWETTVAPDSTDPATPGGGMGYAYRVSLDKVKWPVKDVDDADNDGNTDEIIGYESKWMVFVATNYAAKEGGFGGLHVFALDLETGARVWGFSSQYSTPNNDIPGAVTTVDLDNDAHADRVYVGDINGRMWELEAHDGSNPYGTYLDETDPSNPISFQIPLFDAGVGYPVTVSPAVLMHNGHAILVFGTGGTDWAVNTNTYKIYGVDATAAKNDWDDMSQSEKNAYYLTHNAASTPAWEISLAAGEKVWSTPTIAAGQIWVITSSGSMESVDPGSESAGSSKLRRLDLSGDVQETMDFTNKKIRGSLFVSNNHVYMTTLDNEIIQLGNGDFTTGTGNRVVLKSWRHE
jgi:type IV pilus assembly protein PilY1